VIVVGSRYVDTGNYRPFVPESRSAPDDATTSTVLQVLTGSAGTVYGIYGVLAAASVITFAYIGFDLIATAAEDTHEPRRSIPKAMLISLGLVTLLYLAMAAVLVGLRPFEELGSGAPVSDALAAVGVGWAADVVNFGGLLAFTTVIMVVLIAQSRVLFAMGRDGLLPSWLGQVSPAFQAPSLAAATAGLAATALALYPSVGSLEQLLVIGSLAAFFSCSVGVIVLRRRQPDLERGFRVAGAPLVPALGALATAWLGLNLTTVTWRNFAIWTAIGLALYVGYGRWHSVLARREENDLDYGGEYGEDESERLRPVGNDKAYRGRHASR
jgi:APA family basic amino acid/polyamine antiporter